jgi:hypothetical protein
MTDTTISFPHSILISFFGLYESREPFLPLRSFSSCSFIIFSLWREPSNTGPYFLALENHAHLNDNISKFCNRFCLFQNSLISDNLKTPCNLRISKYPNIQIQNLQLLGRNDYFQVFVLLQGGNILRLGCEAMPFYIAFYPQVLI